MIHSYLFFFFKQQFFLPHSTLIMNINTLTHKSAHTRWKENSNSHTLALETRLQSYDVDIGFVKLTISSNNPQ